MPKILIFFDYISYFSSAKNLLTIKPQSYAILGKINPVGGLNDL